MKFITVSALALTAASVAIASAAGAPARPAAAAGGLSITPTLIEHAASKGSADNVTVTNRSTQKLDITVATRPWHQARDGAVAAKRGSTLRGFDISDTSFTLAPGAKQVVTVTTTTAKERYGALEVIGLPQGADTRKGLVVGYRLIASLRLDPATPVFRFQTSSVKLSGKTLVLPVTSHGNTVQPVSGDVSFKGALGTRSATVHSMRVLPGHTVELPLIAARKLPAGTYRAKIVLKQGNQRGTVTRNVRVKR